VQGGQLGNLGFENVVATLFSRQNVVIYHEPGTSVVITEKKTFGAKLQG